MSRIDRIEGYLNRWAMNEYRVSDYRMILQSGTIGAKREIEFLLEILEEYEDLLEESVSGVSSLERGYINPIKPLPVRSSFSVFLADFKAKHNK